MKSSAASLLAAHGLDAREIATRTDALGLTAERLTALSRCAPLAESSLAAALDRFYARVTALPEFARLAAQPQFLQRLRDANAAYWRSLFTPQIDGDQVAERLAIGVAHHRARLQPAWYVVGCGVMLDALVSALLGAGEVEAALTLIDRVLFDIALSLDAYGMRLESELREGFSSAGQSTEAAAVDPVKPTPRAEPTPLSRMALAQDAAAQRREFIDLDDAAVRELRAAAAVIEATVPTVLADFYAFFTAHPQTARLVPKAAVARLRQQVGSYWLELAAGQFDRAYAASRMRVGMVHERIGLSPQWYLAGLARQLRGILTALFAARPDAAGAARALCRSVLFDVSFVIDAYMESRAESVLRTEGYAARLISSLGAGVIVVDAQHRVVSANKSSVALLGVDAGILSRMPVEAALPLPHVEVLLRQIEQGGAERATALANFGGRLLRLAAVGLSDAGRLGQIALVLDDVTDLQRVATQLDRGSLETAALLDAVPDMLWAVELPSWLVLSMSSQALPLTGLRDLGFLGRSDALLARIPEPDRARFVTLVESLEPGGQDGLEHRLERVDGTVCHVHTTVRRLPRAEAPTVVAGATRDVSALRAERERRLQTVAQITGGVAHEVNNALTVALGELHMMGSEDLPLAADDHRLRAVAACERSARVTRSLLAVAQRQVLAPVEFDLAAALRELRPKLAEFLAPPAEVELVVPEGPMPVCLDRQQLEAVLWQLVDNAKHALGVGGVVTVSLREVQEQELLLSVADNGSGMPPAALARACEPFFTTRGGAAVGLGLSVAQGFCAQSGGWLSLASVLGEGTVVTLRLPRRTRWSAVTSSGARRQPVLLVVDDDDMVRESIRRMAAHSGFRVYAVDSAEAALAHLARVRADAVLTDIVLGSGGDGITLTRQIEVRYPGMPVLVTSGYAAEQLPLHDLIGRVPFLEKPFTAAQLQAALGVLLAAAQV